MLLTCQNLTVAFGGPPVLDGARFVLNPGDRVCLFGRNGEGKSTFLKTLSGNLKPDDGTVDKQKGVIVGYLPQDVPPTQDTTVFDMVTSGLGDVSNAIKRFNHATELISVDPSNENLERLTKAQNALDSLQGWDVQNRVDIVLSKLGLDPETSFATLSGGWRRRASLARVLALSPDVLLLDEPTNHLDVEAIEWLEQFIKGLNAAIVFISHDRRFLRNVATRIVELDRGQMHEFSPDFDTYLEEKEKSLSVEENHDAEFDKKLADEEVWIRQGIKARRTRNEGRVRALKRLRQKRKQRRNRKGTAQIATQSAERSGDDVIVAKNLNFQFNDNTPIATDFSITVKRLERLALVGPNGVGKTTLLRLLLKTMDADSGEVKHGTNLKIRYSDQLREQLDETTTLADTIVPDGDMVLIDGEQKHVISYLRDFLFDADQIRSPVSTLSGGERNRLMLAKLFSEPANVLVLDEPTNDLDIETLQVLEDMLSGFDGTVLFVSHDREFVDAVATTSLVFEENGKVTRVLGGFAESQKYLAQQQQKQVNTTPMETPKPKKTAPKPVAKKRSFKEQHEFDELPRKIEKLETRASEINTQLADPAVYSDHKKFGVLQDELTQIVADTDKCYQRWDELESND